ncbi:DMT family transporter [Paenibacillus piri]|uniref:DMT family transporter n=1 Tax=Paenibacillus piri TaxID=2547395 RepID=UPI001C709420|nr:DMT family transporter [Paenibacillus piri]
MVKSEKIIYIILALVVVSWGLNIVMVKYLTAFIPPMLVAAIRMPLAGIALLPFVFKKYGLYKPNAKEWLLLGLIGAMSIFFSPIVFGIRGGDYFGDECFPHTRIKPADDRLAGVRFCRREA